MSTEMQTVVQDQGLMALQDTSNLVMDEKAMTHMMNVATFMSKGTLTLPEPYRNNPANCLAVVMQAAQWKMNPFGVAQKTHFVNGTIGYEAQLVAAVINDSGATIDHFHFEWYGDWSKILGKFKEVESKDKKDDKGFPKKYKFPDWSPSNEIGLGIKVWATLKGESEPRVLDLLLTQANVRNSTLWADDPRQQLAYLAQKRWARLYAPGVILGVYSPDELQDVAVPMNVTPARTGAAMAEAAKHADVSDDTANERTALLKQLTPIAEKKGLVAYAEAWGVLSAHQRKVVGTVEHERLKAVATAFDDSRTYDNEPSNPTKGDVDDPFVSDMNTAEAVK